jgi:tRNA pseudouridine55 synthase
MDFQRGIIINIDKPKGWTSFDVVRKVRSLVKVKKVGHSGTLDPMAVGVLLVCTGKATKRVAELQELPKEYVADVNLGLETDTLDVTGTVKGTAAIPDDWQRGLIDVLPEFVGDIQQVPPMVSALKRNGIPLYKLARQGLQVSLEARTVTIYGIELLDVSNDGFRIRVRCGGGTYIRSLARDIGYRLGTLGTLSGLVRTSIGPYTRKEGWGIRGFEEFIRQLRN